MKELKMYSQRAERFISAFWSSKATSLFDCYEHFSTAKACADIRCRNMMIEEGGHSYKIISWNSMQFTAAWIVKDDLRIETRDSSYIIKNFIKELPF